MTSRGDIFCGVNISTIPILPDDIQLSYLAEGAANIIYRFSIPLGHPSAIDPKFPPQVDKTHLLRLRKGVDSAFKSLLTFVALQNTFYPLFSKELILDTYIIRIPRSLIERENLVLKEREASGDRLAKRAGLYLTRPSSETTPDGKLEQYEHYGFLVEDMTPTASNEVGISRREVLIEFKPKWLLPSPTAPQGARRCRTCALKALKDSENGVAIIGNGSPNPGYWCPFDLASGEPQRVRRAVKSILMQKGALKTGWKGEISEDERVILENKIVGYFIGPKGTKLLGLLKQYQSDWGSCSLIDLFGKNGDINTEPLVSGEKNSGVWGDEWTEGVKKYLMAMTIRDISLFLKVDLVVARSSDPTAKNESVQAKIGDLDLKSPANGKAKYWIDIERKLIDEGWYADMGRMGYLAGNASIGDKRKPEGADGRIVKGHKPEVTGELQDVSMKRDRDICDRELQHQCTTNINWCTF